MVFKGKSILVTGGTGSFGKRFVRRILEAYPHVKRLVIFSRDELKQYEMSLEFPEHTYPQLRFFLGDMRDGARLRYALEGIDTVIHAAALKQVPAAEYNPFEFIKTNVIGAQNLIEACIDKDIRDVVALSTDKAAAPINLYGATKLCSDKLFVAANQFKGGRHIKFSVVRYGNVMGSRGSVMPFFKGLPSDQPLPVTDESMTRFNITLDQGVDMVLWAMEHAKGGEIFVPKIPSYRVVDVAKAIAPQSGYEVVGVRPGEKIHEEMITASDSLNTLDLGAYYAILPPSDSALMNLYLESGARAVPEGFAYDSGSNPHFLTVDEIAKLVSEEL